MKPLLRYYGSKWRIAPWIIEHFPEHRNYVEPFGGSAAVLLQKPRSFFELYNDVNHELVNLLSVVRNNLDPLKQLLQDTPYSVTEYLRAAEPADDIIEQARRTIVKSFMGRNGTLNAVRLTGFRHSMNTSVPGKYWLSYPNRLELIRKRLRGIVLDCRPAVDVIRNYDSPETLFYLDPPYVAHTRERTGQYVCELTDEDHCELAEQLYKIQGMVIVSGFDSELYAELFDRRGWTRFWTKARTDSNSSRKECIWLSPNIALQPELFRSKCD